LIDARQSSATNGSSVHLDWSTLKNNAPNSIPIKSDAQARIMTATFEKIDLKRHSSAQEFELLTSAWTTVFVHQLLGEW
jgi:hypothetical protein